MHFSGGSDGKESTCNAGDAGLSPRSGRSRGEENGNPLQHSCLEDLHGWRSLVGHSPWDHKESGMTEQLTHTNFKIMNSSDIRKLTHCCLVFSFFRKYLMISVHFQGKPFNITVIQVYAPTGNAEEPEVERFYEDL